MEDRIKPSAKGYAEPVKDKSGTYRLYFSLGKDLETGKYLRSKKRTYHCRSKNPKNWPKELENALANYRKELEGDTEPKERLRTISDYADDFHALRKDTMGSPLAYEREGYDVRHIHELFGDTKLRSLRADDIRHAYAEARRTGRFSESEIRRIHGKLKQILQEAVNNELIDRNPCNSIKLPKVDVEARQSLSTEEAARLLACLLSEPLSAKATGTMLLLQCGLRRGEMLGCTWSDYSPADRTLRISKQYTNDKTLRPPKSKMSRRTIAVNDTLANYLGKWRVAQCQELERYGLEQTTDTPIVHGIKVVAVDDGKHASVVNVDGHNFDRWFRDFCVDNGFGKYENVTNTFMRNGKQHIRGTGYKGLVPHALRHTQATLLIGSGSDVKTVQARLGHASPNTTLSIYAHAIEANDRKAADAFGKLISK